MELRSLVDVELREALAPINRAARGEFLPALRTAAQLRERASWGLLDLKLSRACVIGGSVAAACLVERLADEGIAYIEALAADPLAQQRGAVRALVEAVLGAAKSAGVAELSVLAADMDSAQVGALQAAGFVRRQLVGRYTLSGAPASRPLPVERHAGEPQPAGQPWLETLSAMEGQAILSSLGTATGTFSSRQPVLARLAGRLMAVACFQPAASDSPRPVAIVIGDRERKLVCALAGETDALTSLLCFAAARFGLAHVEALAEEDGAASALLAAGYSRTAVRVEMICDPQQVTLPQRATQAAAPAPGVKGGE